jgi:hypothetical protein
MGTDYFIQVPPRLPCTGTGNFRLNWLLSGVSGLQYWEMARGQSGKRYRCGRYYQSLLLLAKLGASPTVKAPHSTPVAADCFT